MNIRPASTPSGIGCRIASDCFDAAVLIDGLHAAELAYLFGFSRAPAFGWTSLQNRGSIRIALDTAAPTKPATALNLDLEDGHVTMASDQPATLNVLSHHSLRPALFPKSLNLCLSQQFARAGVLPVHGAGVVLGELGIMILGGKAAGKSTLTAASLAAGARVISDDWMLFGIGRDNRPSMERLRQFLMLRHGDSTDVLLRNASAPPFKSALDRPKATLAISPDLSEFPRCHRIDKLWLMHRPIPRPERSEAKPQSQRESLAALLTHSMPLLFSQGFSSEHETLNIKLNSVVTSVEASKITTGLDLVNHPQKTLDKLLRTSSRHSERRHAETLSEFRGPD